MTASCAIEAGRSDSCPSPQALFNLVKSTQWIKRNMITVDPDKLSNSLGRKLTDAEIKVLRCLEGLEVPDWYTENSKPRKILNYDQPIDYRLSQPPRWKTMRSKVTNSPKKSTSRPSSRNSPKSSPRKSCTEDASYYTSTMDSGYNEDCGRPRRQQPTSRSLPYSVASSSASSSEQSLAPIDSSSEADEERTPSPEVVRSQNQRVVEVEIHKAPQPRKPISRSASRSNREAASRQLQDSSSDADESVPQSKSSLRRSTPGKARHTLPISEPIASVPLGRCHTFPRLSPSRKIENINIVFEKPWPPQEPATQQREQEDHQDDQQAADLLKSPDAGRTLYTTTKSICLHSPASFFTAEVDLGNSTLCQVDQDDDDDNNKDDDHKDANVIGSPTDRFFESDKKSRALEAIVQTKRHLPADRSSFIQEKLSELERSVALSSSGSLRGSFYREDKSMTTGSYVKSVVSELERSFDSDPAESCSVPYRSSSGEDSSAEEAPSTSPLPAPTASSSVCCSNDDTKNQDDGFGDVYWIPVNPAMLPRTSSLLSGLGSRASSRLSRASARSGRNSPGLSPIRHLGLEQFQYQQRQEQQRQQQQQQQLLLLQQQQQQKWGQTHSRASSSRSSHSSRKLFKIDEARAVPDSGFSDRYTPLSISSSCLSFGGMHSLTPSPTLTGSSSPNNSGLLAASPCIMRSIFV